ncbi:MAG TPA: metalloregulator ArsR/SmtB family transcription factor [Polyangiaceae bacterium]|jgi:DNA-binding transcriptional ArsR family regulator
MARSSADASVFQAIACPTRRALLDTLARGESNVSDLVGSLDVTQSAVSQQLGVLKSAGLVEERTEGRFRYYRLQAKPLRQVDAWLERYRAHVEGQLDALGQVLDAMPDDGPAPSARPTRTRRRRT